jgi:hypothetical protein
MGDIPLWGMEIDPEAARKELKDLVADDGGKKLNEASGADDGGEAGRGGVAPDDGDQEPRCH